MIAGSFVGGIVTELLNEEAATLVAAGGNIFCGVVIIIFIPSDTKSIRRSLEHIYKTDAIVNNSTDPPKIGLSLGLKEILSVLKMKNIKYLLFIKILSTFPFGLAYSMFTMAIMDYYHLGPRENGIILAYVGALGIFIQGFLIGLLTGKFGDATLVKYAMILNTAAFLFLVIAENIFFFCFLILPLAIGGTVSHIVLTSAVTKVVPIEDTGSALGLTLALHALVRSIAPTLGGLVFTTVGWPFIGVIGYAIHLFLSGFIVLYGREI